MEKKLYFIENCGCDDTTYGLHELTDDEYKLFIQIIENLNKGSHYGCQPTIRVREIKRELIKPYVEDDEWEDKFYLNGEPYCFIDPSYIWRMDCAPPKVELNGIENNEMPF